MSRRILIPDPVDPICADILRQKGFEVDQLQLTEQELLDRIKDYDGLIVRSETKVTADVLNAASKLNIVGRAGTGTDNIDCDAATDRNVLVMNVPGGNTISAAEHACALIGSVARNIVGAYESIKNGIWDPKSFIGNELKGKTLGIVGFGRIGKEVAVRMQSFGMILVGFDPFVSEVIMKEHGVDKMCLDEIWPIADYITLHLPLCLETTSKLLNQASSIQLTQTNYLVDSEVLQKCKKGFRLVNTSRGGIVNEKDLLLSLKSGQCGGAGLDVFVEEPPTSDYYKELLAQPNMVCTPHLGCNAIETQKRVAQSMARQLIQFFKGEAFVGGVNKIRTH